MALASPDMSVFIAASRRSTARRQPSPPWSSLIGAPPPGPPLTGDGRSTIVVRYLSTVTRAATRRLTMQRSVSIGKSVLAVTLAVGLIGAASVAGAQQVV